MALYLDGTQVEQATLRVFIFEPGDQTLLLPEAQLAVSVDPGHSMVFAVQEVGDEDGTLTLRCEEGHTVAVWIDDRIQVDFKFLVQKRAGGDANAGSGG